MPSIAQGDRGRNCSPSFLASFSSGRRFKIGAKWKHHQPHYCGDQVRIGGRTGNAKTINRLLPGPGISPTGNHSAEFRQALYRVQRGFPSCAWHLALVVGRECTGAQARVRRCRLTSNSSNKPSLHFTKFNIGFVRLQSTTPRLRSSGST